MLQILDTVTCGNMTAGIDSMIPQFITNIIKVFQIAIPVILVVLGMVDIGKAVTSNDEKQMKEAQKTLIKRVIYAVLVFFIIALVKFVFSTLGNSSAGQNTSEAGNCIDCFLNYDNAECKKAVDKEKE